jgi:hypothetical protein
MAGSPQARALARYRKRLKQKGMSRFEVLAPAKDRELIRAMAQRLAEDGSEAAEIRSVIHSKVMLMPQTKGRILATLRRSPLVGAELDLNRPRIHGRRIDL